MLHDSALQDRLNAVKEGKPIPQPPREEVTPQVKGPRMLTPKEFFINEGYKTFQVLTTSILYGFGINAIFAQDWNFMSLFGVGLIFNHLFSNSISLISKLFKK